MIEMEKLADVKIETDGQGTVTARHFSSTYDEHSGVYMEGTRLYFSAEPDDG